MAANPLTTWCEVFYAEVDRMDEELYSGFHIGLLDTGCGIHREAVRKEFVNAVEFYYNYYNATRRERSDVVGQLLALPVRAEDWYRRFLELVTRISEYDELLWNLEQNDKDFKIIVIESEIGRRAKVSTFVDL